MSLAIALTKNQVEIEKAERETSALLRKHRALFPPALYNELQIKLCLVASEATKLKTNLGALRMIGELDQQPPPVTAEMLELAECVPMLPEHALRDESAAFAMQLQHIGDDTLKEERSAA